MAGDAQGLIRLTVGDDEAGQRLDRYLAARQPDLSRSQIKKRISEGAVWVNGSVRKASEAVAAGDVVEFEPPARDSVALVATPMDLDVLYEDDDLVVVNKPAGVAVHPGAGDTGPTLVEGLLAHVGGAGNLSSSEDRPGIVHRLDKDTTGALVCAKTDETHEHLAAQFREKTGRREYLALLDGGLEADERVVENYLRRDPRSRLRFSSVTLEEYELVQGAFPDAALRYAKSWFLKERVIHDRVTLARVRLFTGRTHQIRVHAVDLGRPVLGDPLYHRPAQLPKSFSPEARRRAAAVRRQMLHAAVLEIRHPKTGQWLRFEAPLPNDFRELLEVLETPSPGG